MSVKVKNSSETVVVRFDLGKSKLPPAFHSLSTHSSLFFLSIMSALLRANYAAVTRNNRYLPPHMCIKAPRSCHECITRVIIGSGVSGFTLCVGIMFLPGDKALSVQVWLPLGQ